MELEDDSRKSHEKPLCSLKHLGEVKWVAQGDDPSETTSSISSNYQMYEADRLHPLSGYLGR